MPNKKIRNSLLQADDNSIKGEVAGLTGGTDIFRPWPADMREACRLKKIRRRR
jgi:hypothetical protein